VTPTNKRLDDKVFDAEREDILRGWPTGKDVDFLAGVKRQTALPCSKRFSNVLSAANAQGQTLLQPRAGVALLREHIELMQGLTPHCDVLPSTIDAYTRLNRYEDAQKGIERSVDKPIQVRHGTPDARLLGEITLSAGFSSYEGGGISYNIPYAKSVSLEKSIRDWQYCDRLIGRYEEEGVRINREPFGPLTGTLVPPFVSHVVAITEGLLALEQGAKCLTLGYGQAGNLIQDVAAIRALRNLAHHYFQKAGFQDYALSTVFHQWMGGFPEDEAQATAVICLGALAARMAKVTKIIVKTPHEAAGVPTLDANIAGLRATRQMVNMISDQTRPDSEDIIEEAAIIEAEVHAVMANLYALGSGDLATGVIAAFGNGQFDIPFSPALANSGKLTPIRDNLGAVRVFDFGDIPMPEDIRAFHHDKIAERAKVENREASFDMVVDDVRAISASKLIGRPVAA